MYKLVEIILIVALFSLVSCKDSSEAYSEFGSLNDRVAYLESKIKSLDTRYEILTRRIQSKNTNHDTGTDSGVKTPKATNKRSPVKEGITLKLDRDFYDDAYIGTSSPKIVVVIYSDLNCANCKSFLSTLIPSLRENYKSSLNVQARLRDFPLEKYPLSSHYAQATHCVGEQGHYWNFVELLLKSKPQSDDDILRLANNPKVNLKDLQTLSQCLKSSKYEKEVTKDKESGIHLGVEGVPSVFIGKKVGDEEFKGAIIRGSQDISIIHKYIELLESDEK